MNAPTVSVRLQAVGGDKVKAEFAQIGRTGSQSLDGLTKASRANAFQMQNAALQVGDFFVQVAGGQSATRALAQQLPQLLGGFGLFGALAGAAFAALSPLIAKMFEGAEAADELDERMKSLADSTRAHADAVKAAHVPVEELVAQYGSLADEVLRSRQNMEDLTAAQALADRNAAVDATARTVGGDALEIIGPADIDALDEFIVKGEIAQSKLDELYAFTPESWMRADQLAAVQQLADAYGLTAEEALRLVQASTLLENTSGAEAQAEAADALRAALVDAFGSVEAVDAALPGVLGTLDELVESAGRLASNMGFSADEAKRLVDNISAALDRKDRADAYIKNAKIIGAYQEYARTRMAAPDTPVVHPETGSRGGVGRRGGGGVDPRIREAERWYEKTRTAAERYAEELADLNELQKLGYLDADTYARAVKEIGEAYGEAGEQAKFWQGIQDDFKNGLLDAIVAGKGLSEVFDNLAKSIARAALESALFNTGPWGVSGGGGGLLGGLLGGIFGGFRADGGPVSAGRAYVVGERGPELFAPGLSGTIIPADRLTSTAAGSVDVRVFVDEGGNWQAAVERISGNVSAAVVAQNNRRIREAQRR